MLAKILPSALGTGHKINLIQMTGWEEISLLCPRN